MKSTYFRWNKLDDSGSKLFSPAGETKKVKLHKEVSLVWGLFQPTQSIHTGSYRATGYWLRSLCSVINSTLDVYPKAFYFSNYPRKSAVFPIVRMVSAEFFLLGHVSPRLLGAAWLIGNKVSISLWLIPLHCRAHPTLGCAPGSCRKKSTGLIHLLSVDSPALLQLLSLLPSIAAQLWWKKARAEMLVLVRGFLVGLYPKGSSYKQEIPFFFFQRWKPHPHASPPF